MSLIVHKRILGERVMAFIKNNDPDMGDMVGLLDALSDVFTDQLQLPVTVRATIGAVALAKAHGGNGTENRGAGHEG